MSQPICGVNLNAHISVEAQKKIFTLEITSLMVSITNTLYIWFNSVGHEGLCGSYLSRAAIVIFFLRFMCCLITNYWSILFGMTCHVAYATFHSFHITCKNLSRFHLSQVYWPLVGKFIDSLILYIFMVNHAIRFSIFLWEKVLILEK